MNRTFCYKHFLCVSLISFLWINEHGIKATVQSSQPTSGVDTMLPEEKIGVQGNWVKKKDWLLKLNDVNAQIQDLAVTISGYKKSFNNKFYAADSLLQNFYKDIGQQQGKIIELFDSVLRYLESKRKKDLTEINASTETGEPLQGRERLIKIEIVEQKINSLKNDLEQLKLDMKSVEELGKSMDARIKKVDEAIKSALDEASEAQKSTEEAWQIIDDKKVRIKYYELSGTTLEKIKAIDIYLKDDLPKDFDIVIETIKSQVDKIMVSIKQLEDKGLIIKNRAKRIEEIKHQELKRFKEHQQAEVDQRKQLAALKQRKAAQPWYKRFYQLLVDKVASIIKKIYAFFGYKDTSKNKQTSSIAPIQPGQFSSLMHPALSLQGQHPNSAQQSSIQFPQLPIQNPLVPGR